MPAGGLEEFLLNGGRSAGFGVPDSFDDGLFGFGEFDVRCGHGATISTIVNPVKRILYKCK